MRGRLAACCLPAKRRGATAVIPHRQAPYPACKQEVLCLKVNGTLINRSNRIVWCTLSTDLGFGISRGSSSIRATAWQLATSSTTD